MWRFRHALIRDAAYAGLPYRLRRRMHDYAGRVIESTVPDVDEVCERLSMHFFHAGDMERAWTYSRMAGRRAQAQYAYTGAIGFFERAIASAHAAGATPEEIGTVTRRWETSEMSPGSPATPSPRTGGRVRTGVVTRSVSRR